MSKTTIATAVAHSLPADVKKALGADVKAREIWNALTPLARNEWICWIISVKKQETRNHHITRMRAELTGGKRRPCCWAGCSHR